MTLKAQITKEPKVREEYLKKLDEIRKEKYTQFNSINNLIKATPE